MRWMALGVAASVSFSARGVDLAALEGDPALTPATLARHFAGFAYSYGADVQSPQVFLSRKAGDCDDYAILSARVLRARGFTTRLITVRLPHEVHVVCYVDEAGAYLDYNQRNRGNGLVPSGAAIAEIAGSVARSFRSSWIAAAEFTYRDGQKRLVRGIMSSPAVVADHAAKGTS